jgi:hypothetical protein
MIDQNETIRNEETAPGTNGPVSLEKMKEYGKKAYLPLLSVVHKYQDEFTPYLDALSKGLRGGVERLEAADATDADRYVSRFFREAAEGIGDARRRLETRELSDLTAFVSDLAARKPSLTFSTSYIAGLFFGRLSRHIIHGRAARNSTAEAPPAFEKPLSTELPSRDQSIH